VGVAADAVPSPAKCLIDTSSTDPVIVSLINDNETFNVHCKLVNDLEQGVYAVHSDLDNLIECLMGTSIQVSLTEKTNAETVHIRTSPPPSQEKVYSGQDMVYNL
ncbi:unnamed protein product, partial [Trichobilharzia regenti]